MANSPVITGLLSYVEQHKSELLAKAMLKSKSSSLFELMAGVVGPTTLNLLDADVTFGDGGACGWNDNGTITLSQRTLTPAALSVQVGYCQNKLMQTYQNNLLSVAAGRKNMPYEAEILDVIVKKTSEKVEKLIWRGDSTQSEKQFDGLIKIAEASGSGFIIDTDGAGTSAYNVIKDAIKRLPAESLAKGDCVVFCGRDLYNEFIQDLVSANLFHYNPENGGEEYLFPGTNVKVIAVDGLNKVSGDTYQYAFAGPKSDFVYGISAEDDDKAVDSWFSKDNGQFRIEIDFNAGVQVSFPSEIVVKKRTI